VSPTALQFIVPRDAPRTLTVTSKTASAALIKPRGMADYMGTFTVTPSPGATGPGACAIALTDKKGGQQLGVERRKQPIPAREANAMLARLYRAWGKRASS
jgi:hypothetical protein